MDEHSDFLKDQLISIASELFRFQRVYTRAIAKLNTDEQKKYIGQFSWFSKQVTKALNNANITIVNPEGERYDVGMAVTPLNLDEISSDENLYIIQTVEPIVMCDSSVVKTGTVILGRKE